MESVNFILIFSFEQKSIFFHWNHNPKEIRNVIFHYLGNGGGRKITHQKWKRCLISLYGLTYSRTDSFSLILCCGFHNFGVRENGLKQGTFPFYVISADYHLSGITTWPEFWSKLPKNIQKPQQMTFMIIMFIRSDRTYRYSICTRLWKTGVGKKITILVNFKFYSIENYYFSKIFKTS